MLTVVDISAALAQFGPARVFAGTALTVAGLVEIGAVEGPITFRETWNENKLTAKRTGGIAHSVLLTLESVEVSFPLIVTSTNLLTPHPLGLKSGGDDRPLAAIPATWLIIPESEVGDVTPLSHDGTNWLKDGVSGAASAPKLAYWLWKAYPTIGDMPITDENGGKGVKDVTLHGMYDGTKPRKHRVYTQGDPRAVSPTPIPVLL